MSSPKHDTVRLFFGLKLTGGVLSEVTALQQRLQGTRVRVKWVEPENLHFTLRFLGHVPESILPDLESLGDAAARAVSPWELRLGGLEAFPSLGRPQTLYVGVSAGADQLTRLARALSRELDERAEFARDRKPFVAHCTIGRVKQDRGLQALTARLETELGFAGGAMQCTQFALVASELRPRGPIYTEMHSFVLSPGTGPETVPPRPETPD